MSLTSKKSIISISLLLLFISLSFGQAAVALLSPADVHINPGGRFEARYQGNIDYLNFQHEHYGHFMLEAFASRHFEPGKLLERMWDGEYAGKWLDAATRTAVNTGDEAQLSLVDTFVDSLLDYQQTDGYLGIKLPTDRELEAWEKEWDNWNLWNALNGLLSHFELRGSEQSLEAASAIGLWIVNTYGPLTRSSDPFLNGEVIEAFTNVVVIGQLVRLYKHTGNEAFLNFVQGAIRNYRPIQEMVSSGEPYLIHPYMLSAVLGGMLAYASETSDRELLKTVEKVWESLSSDHLFPTGSLGERENLDDDPIQDVPGGQLQETCATTEWIFLNTKLFEITGRERYMAALEKTCYNALLAAQSADGMKWCYWTPLRYSKDWFHGPTRCCFWSGPRGISRIPQLIYTYREDIIYVNMFESSQATLPHGKSEVKILQESEFPEKGKTKITLKAPEEWTGVLRVRMPEWTSGFRISLNGKKTAGEQNEEAFLDIADLKNEDQIEIDFEIPLFLEQMNKQGYVVRRGPEVLSIDIRDNIDTWLGSDDLISIPEDLSLKETESFSAYSWPGPRAGDEKRRRYRVEVQDVRTDEARSVILTPYADAGNDGAAYRTVFPLAEKP